MILGPLMVDSTSSSCLFCQIVRGDVAALKVFEDEVSLAFLDHRPVFPGHCLLIPKAHFETLADLPTNLIGPLFQNAQLLARAVENAMEAHGTFVAMNNRVSQSVPHFHVHVVPRWKGDTNFMSVAAGVRVVPEELSATRARLAPLFARAGS